MCFGLDAARAGQAAKRVLACARLTFRVFFVLGFGLFRVCPGPVRRAFSPADAKEARLVLEQRRKPDMSGYYYVLNGARYEDGYLVRSYALKNLQAEEALPPLEDLQRFNQAGFPKRVFSGLGSMPSQPCCKTHPRQ